MTNVQAETIILGVMKDISTLLPQRAGRVDAGIWQKKAVRSEKNILRRAALAAKQGGTADFTPSL